jgi:hypothetical protein
MQRVSTTTHPVSLLPLPLPQPLIVKRAPLGEKVEPKGALDLRHLCRMKRLELVHPCVGLRSSGLDIA